MADKSLQLALRIKADLEQGQAELKQLGAVLEQAGQQAQQTNSQLGATGRVVDQAGAAAQRSASAGDALIASLREQIALFGQSQEVVQLYRAAELGAAEAAAPLIQRLSELRTAQQQAAAAAQAEEQAQRQAAAALQAAEGQRTAFLAGLQEQVALFAKSQDEVLRYRAAQLGAADAVEPLIKQLSELRTAQQQAAAAAQAEEQAQRQAAAAVQSAESQRTAFLASLQEQADLQGKSRLEMLEYRAAQLGVTREAASYIARLREAGEAQGKAGISAGQYQQAMRMLPMQMTDVATSLASGMPLWMVAIQQGGQIRDSFGGIGAAARAVVSTISPLAAGIAAAAAGIGVLGGAVLSAISELNDFNRALISTGKAAGLTVESIRSMTEELAGGRHYSQAADALMAVVSSGKLTGDTLKAVAAAAVQMSVATGEGADQIAQKLIGAKDNVGKLAAEYNAQYHFMSAATYEQIAALEDQGRKMDALKLLSTSLASEMTARNEEIRTSTRGIASAWDAAKEALSGYWQQLKKGVTADPETFKLQVLQQQVEDAKSGYWTSEKARNAAIAPMLAEIDLIQKRQAAKAEEASKEAEYQAKQQAAIEAASQLERTREQIASKAEQREKARADYLERVNKVKAANPSSPLVDPARVTEDLAAIDEKYKDPEPKKAPKAPVVRDDAATKMLQTLREQQATLQEQLGSETKISEAQRQQAQFTQLIADLKGKAVLTAEQKSLLANQDAIKAQLAVNVALDEQIRKRQNLAENARANAGLQADYLRSIGQESAAAMLEIQVQMDQMRKEFTLRGNSEGLSLIDQLLPAKQAKARLDEVQAEVDKAIAAQQRQEQSVNVQQDAGLLTEMDARQKILDIHRQTYEKLQQVRPVLEEMARQPGAVGDAAAVALQSLDDQATRLKSTTTLLSETLSSGLQNGLSNALSGLATGTLTLRGAIQSLANTVVQAMAQMAANQLAQKAMSSVMGTFGVPVLQKATGGHVTGPGTTTSDSIPAMLSNWEFVTRAAVVQQPGALPFLHDFNARGMPALDDYARRVRHATGGLAGVPAPALPAPMPGNVQLAEPAKSLSATLNNSQTFILADDPNRILDAAWGASGTDRLIVALSRDPAKFRSILQL